MSYSDINFSTKKVLGYANTSLDSTITYNSDLNIPSFQKISINQIYGQSIPATVNYVVKNNIDFGKSSLPGLTFNGYIDSLGKLHNNPPTGTYGCLYTVDNSPHIQYVQSLPITNRFNNSSVSGSRTIFNIDTKRNGFVTNYFTNIIPFSYGSGYGYSLTQGYQLQTQLDSSTGKNMNVMNKNAQCMPYSRNSINNIVDPNDYVIDPDAGLLYIKNDDWNFPTGNNITIYNGSNGFPTLSFFRYAGKMGIDSLPAGAGSSAGSSSAGILMDAPPAPMSITGTVDPLNAYIYFTYPDQVNSGIGLLPRIDTFYVNVKGPNEVTGSTTITIPNTNSNTKVTYSVTGTNYLSITEAAGPIGSLFITTDRIINTTGTYGVLESTQNPPSGAGIIQCINFSKTAKTGSLGTMPVSPFLNYYSIRYEDRNNADVYLWYGNKNRKPNIASCSFKYLAGGDPSNPAITSVIPSSSNGLSINWKGSDKFDATEETSLVPTGGYLLYQVSYGPTGANNYRYGGIVGPVDEIQAQSYINSTVGGTGLTVIISSPTTPVFPDTYFFATIKALNSSNLTGTGAFATATTVMGTTGPPLRYTQGNNTTNVEGTTLNTLISAKLVSDNSSVPNLLKSNTDGYKFNTPVNIHNSYTSRGSTGMNLVTFNANLNTTIGPSSYGLNGFGSNLNSDASANGITISSNYRIDQYNTTDWRSQGYDNYYLQNSMTVSVDNTKISSSSSLYTLSLNGLYSPNNSGVNCTFNSSFYYDGEKATPTIGSVKTSYPSSSSILTSFTQVCGIYIVNIPDDNTIKFEVETKDVKNLGKNFYNSSWVLEYSQPSTGFTIDSNVSKETNLTNLEGAYSDLNTTFKNKSLSISINSPTLYFRDTFKLNVQAQNVHGDKSVKTESTDKNNYKYIFDKQALALSSMSDIPGLGFRIYSGVMPGTYEDTPRGGPVPVSNIPFDHTKSLLSDYSSELLYANGMYVTPNPNPNEDYYLKYSDYYAGQGNTQPDYSSIPMNGYRYATFIWSIPSNYLNSSTPLSTLNFSILGVKGIDASDGIAYTTTSNIKIYYCVVDSGSNFVRIVPQSQICLTTYWINANSSTGDQITSSNCYQDVNPGNITLPANGYTGSENPSVTKSNDVLTFSVRTGGYTISETNTPFGPVYIYLRIGLPMNVSSSFSSVRCNLSQ